MKQAVGLRFFGKTQDDIERLRNFLDEAIQYNSVHVAINSDIDTSGAINFIRENYPQVDVFGVTPWQKFVAPCNALIYRAALTEAQILLTASTEFPMKKEYVDALLLHLNEDTLFVGARFTEHEFEPGEHIATAFKLPWGNFGIWNLHQLQKLGMPLIGDASFNPTQAGVEEMTTIALYQERSILTGFAAKAKLVDVPYFYQGWNTTGWDDERHEKHKIKMMSKSSRIAEQLAFAGMKAPSVIHIA